MRLKHGGELRHFSERFSISEGDILDFSSNINPLGPPESVEEIYQSSFHELRSYPDSECLEFRREVARHFPLWPENVIASNGAVELFDLIVRFLRPKRAFLVEPTFAEYRRILNIQGTEIRSMALKEKEGFRFSVAEVSNALQGVDLAILCQPNNPTGTFLSKTDMERLIQETRRRSIFVVLDEAFVDWVPELSMAGEVRDDSQFFVVRSLTKFFALPGIRIGYGLGSRKLIEKLSTYQLPWSTNRLAQKLGIAALRDKAFQAASRAWLVDERTWLEANFRELPWLKVYPAAANFLLLRCTPDAEGTSLADALGRQGIYVRDLSDLAGLGSSFIRISVRKREENLRLLEGFRMSRRQKKEKERVT